MGFGVSSRNFPHATDRNRIKRLGREAYRLQQQSLQENLREKQRQIAVFFIYTGKKIPSFDTVHDKISVILNRLIAEIAY